MGKRYIFLFCLCFTIVLSTGIFAAAPLWSANTSSVANNTEYAPGRNYGFQAFWANTTVAILNVTFETDFNGTFINYTNITPSGGPNLINTSTAVSQNGTYWINFTDLGTNTYSYRWIATNASGISGENATDWFNYTVQQNQTNPVSIYLINTTSSYANQNMTSVYLDSVTFNVTLAYSNSGSGYMFKNGTLISSTNTETNATMLPAVYNFTFNVTGNTNYTSNTSNLMYFLTISGLANSAACSANNHCNSNYCVHSVCRATSTYCDDDYCDSGETCSSCPTDCSCGGDILPVAPTPVEEESSELEVLVKIEKSIDQVEKGVVVEIEIEELTDDETKLKGISITPAADGTDVSVEVEETSTAPLSASEGVSSDGKKITISEEERGFDVYQYIKITTDIEVESAELTFEVSADWLGEKDKDDVVLLHFSDGWKELPTEYVSGTDPLVFKAETDLFSVFAVGIESEEVVDTGTDMDQIMLIIVILVIIVGLVLWKGTKLF